MKDILMKIVEQYGDCYRKGLKNTEDEMKEWASFNYDVMTILLINNFFS